MSYDIRVINQDGEHVQLKERHVLTGGTYVLDGTTDAWLNVTYNYGDFFRKYVDAEQGIRAIYGKSITEADELLTKAIEGIEKDYPEVFDDDPPGADDYWQSSPFNAVKALRNLRTIGELALKDHPDEALEWTGD